MRVLYLSVLNDATARVGMGLFASQKWVSESDIKLKYKFLLGNGERGREVEEV